MEEQVKTEAGGTEVLIDVRHLTKHYGPIKAVDGISFQVRRGDILGFLGPNGAGKSTAMKMITCFLDPDGGTASVANHDIYDESLEVRQKVGYLPENAPAYGEMTVTGFLQFIAEARAIPDPAKAIERVIGMTALESVVHQTIDTLSKGFMRRVGLAQALIHDPEVLILDEPTDGLDPNQKAMIQELIGNLSQDRAIVMSTHILDEVERVCNRALIISEGKIIVDSTPEALLAQAPNHNVIRVVLEESAEEVIPRIQEQEWCRQVTSVSASDGDGDGGSGFEVFPSDGANHMPELYKLLDGLAIRSVHLQEGRLNELFRSLTEGVCA